MNTVSTALKALGHPERLRILALLATGELTVSELTQILSLSQPRITQYIQTLENAGIVERLKEGSWVFSRLNRSDPRVTSLINTVLDALPEDDKNLRSDQRRLEDVRAVRAKATKEFFARVAADQDQLSAEYLPRGNIETQMRVIADKGPFDFMVDLGTGTGRILDVFADRVKGGIGIDSNHTMLKVARHNLDSASHNHLSVRQGDLHSTSLDDGVADFVTLHQVLHFLDEPRIAINEAARILRPNGYVLIVDFIAHKREEFRDKYAHRRLGFTTEDIVNWFTLAGLNLENTQDISMQNNSPDVRLWLASKPAAS